MSPGSQRSNWKGSVLFLALLAASLRPAWGSAPPGGRAVSEAELSSCCVAPEAGGCCPEEERGEPGPSYLPLCCGVDAPVSQPDDRGQVPASTVVDPTTRVLGELARALQQFDALAEVLPQGEPEESAQSPPGAAPRSASVGSHWLTDHDLLETLALLSIARS